MLRHKLTLWSASFILAACGLTLVAPAHGFRMMQNKATGQVTSADLVRCDDSDGFAHWEDHTIEWNMNFLSTTGARLDTFERALGHVDQRHRLRLRFGLQRCDSWQFQCRRNQHCGVVHRRRLLRQLPSVDRGGVTSRASDRRIGHHHAPGYRLEYRRQHSLRPRSDVGS